MKKKNFPFYPFAVLMVSLLLGSCASHQLPERTEEGSKLRITQGINGSSRPLMEELNTYTAVYALYSGMFIGLNLVEELSIAEKARIIRSLYREPDGSGVFARIRLRDYYERGDLHIYPTFFKQPSRHIHWQSDAIYSPITKSPMRGEGKILEKDAPLGNVQDMIFLKDGFAVRIFDILSSEAELEFRKNEAFLNLADMYIHDGRVDNDAQIIPLLEKAARQGDKNPRIPYVARLTEVQYFLYRGDYQRAYEEMIALLEETDLQDQFYRTLLKISYELYALCDFFDNSPNGPLREFEDFLSSPDQAWTKQLK